MFIAMVSFHLELDFINIKTYTIVYYTVNSSPCMAAYSCTWSESLLLYLHACSIITKQAYGCLNGACTITRNSNGTNTESDHTTIMDYSFAYK